MTTIPELDPYAPLTSTMLYQRDIALTCPPSFDQVIADGTENRAKAGDKQAQERLLLALQTYIHYWAGRYARAYAWASPRIEYSELVSAANSIAWERMERATTRERMLAYLAGVAKLEIRHYCLRYASPITTPPDSHTTPIFVDRLERKVSWESDQTLGESIAAPDLLLLSERERERFFDQSEQQMQALRQVLPSLSSRSQQVLTRYYGLGGQDPQTFAQIGQTLSSHHVRADEAYRSLLRAQRQLRDVLKLPHTQEDQARIGKQQEQNRKGEAARKLRKQSLSAEERERMLARKREVNRRSYAKKRALQIQEVSA